MSSTRHQIASTLVVRPGKYLILARSADAIQARADYIYDSFRLANSAARVQASSMGMGQAAAATAVLAVQLGVTPADVPLATIRDELKKHGVTP